MNNLTQQNAAGAEELASIMAMFRTNHHSAEIFRERKKTIESKQTTAEREPGQKTMGSPF
jgi:hypothetical protein